MGIQGVVLLNLPRVSLVCKKLGVDYAPAMHGFELRGGRSVPIISGVCVCEEHAAAVQDAYEEEER